MYPLDDDAQTILHATVVAGTDTENERELAESLCAGIALIV